MKCTYILYDSRIKYYKMCHIRMKLIHKLFLFALLFDTNGIHENRVSIVTIRTWNVDRTESCKAPSLISRSNQTFLSHFAFDVSFHISQISHNLRKTIILKFSWISQHNLSKYLTKSVHSSTQTKQRQCATSHREIFV